MTSHPLETIAKSLVRQGKGILAADESNGTMSKRLEAVGIEANSESRRLYRTAMFSTPGLEKYISGVILFDETIRQKMEEGTPIPRYLTDRGILPGIKVDTGAKPLAGHTGETVTEGLDGLRERCEEYYNMGARFAKWRAVISISENRPSAASVSTNSHALARYASICQEQGLVPIIEPEVLMDGGHSIMECFEVTSRVLKAVYSECQIQGVMLSGTILKPNMVLSGKESPGRTADEVAKLTCEALQQNVPNEVAGIAFLSGGQSDYNATNHLNRINQIADKPPWPITFSFGRALLADALSLWARSQTEDAQTKLLKRSAENSLASEGCWEEGPSQ